MSEISSGGLCKYSWLQQPVDDDIVEFRPAVIVNAPALSTGLETGALRIPAEVSVFQPDFASLIDTEKNGGWDSRPGSQSPAIYVRA